MEAFLSESIWAYLNRSSPTWAYLAYVSLPVHIETNLGISEPIWVWSGPSWAYLGLSEPYFGCILGLSGPIWENSVVS